MAKKEKNGAMNNFKTALRGLVNGEEPTGEEQGQPASASAAEQQEQPVTEKAPEKQEQPVPDEKTAARNQPEPEKTGAGDLQKTQEIPDKRSDSKISSSDLQTLKGMSPELEALLERVYKGADEDKEQQEVVRTEETKEENDMPLEQLVKQYRESVNDDYVQENKVSSVSKVSNVTKMRDAGGSSYNRTVISDDVEIIGDIRSRGDIDIRGSVQGNVMSEGHVMVSGAISGSVVAASADFESGTLSGDSIQVQSHVEVKEGVEIVGEIQASSIEVNGSIQGNIMVEDQVELNAGAAIAGDITAQYISIQKGAILNGKLSINQNMPAYEAPQVPAGSARLPRTPQIPGAGQPEGLKEGQE